MMRATPPRANVLAIDAHPEFCPLLGGVSGDTEERRYRRELAALCRQVIRIGEPDELEIVRGIMAHRAAHPNFRITTKTGVPRKRAESRS
jgi:hypothetical protein